MDFGGIRTPLPNKNIYIFSIREPLWLSLKRILEAVGGQGTSGEPLEAGGGHLHALGSIAGEAVKALFEFGLDHHWSVTHSQPPSKQR
jgi:hypothetical protein